MDNEDRGSINDQTAEAVTGGKTVKPCRPTLANERCDGCGAGKASYKRGGKYYCASCAAKLGIAK